MISKASRGISLVEVVLGAGIISAFLVAALGTFGGATLLGGRNVRQVQAAYLAEEGIEALKIMRDAGYTANLASLTAGGSYYLAFDGITWRSTTTNSLIDGKYERKFVLSQVRRDNSTKDIVSSGGAVDASTTLAAVSVSWRENAATTTKTIKTYLTNIFGN